MPDLQAEADELAAHTLGRGFYELRVIELLSQGDSYQQIATRLDITVDAARQRASRAARKLGARSVPHAIAIAVTGGHIPGVRP
jgi:DNA-binding CsgD family transcriptional regulator